MSDALTTPAGHKPLSGFERRTARISLTVPIEVKGIDASRARFNENTRTEVITRHGAMIVLRRALAPGQEISIRCIGTGREAAGRVVSRVAASAEGSLYGIEIFDPDVDLWEIHFPPATESEMAAGRLLLECARCNACEVVYLNLGEIESFDSSQRVSRHCQHCNDVTPWSEALLRKLLVEPVKLAIDPLVGQSVPAAPQRAEGGRVDPRISLNIAGCIRTPQFGEEIVTTENVSEGGVGFVSPNQYACGAIVAASIPFLQGRGNVFVPGRITWSQSRPEDGRFAYGLEYIHARRRAERVKPKEAIAIGLIGSGIRSTGNIVDISMTGVLMRCGQLAVGMAVRMGIAMGLETIRMGATAKRSVPGVGTAFEFTQMAQRDRSMLRRLILRLEREWR